MDTTINPTAISKPALIASKPASNNKSGFDADIDKLEILRLKINSSINDSLYRYFAISKDATVDNAKALNTLRLEANEWFAYAVKISMYAGEKVKEVDEKIVRTSTLSSSVRKLVISKLDQQRESLIAYRDNLLPLISGKREPFNRVLDECNELLSAIDILGRKQTVSLIIERLGGCRASWLSIDNINCPSIRAS